MQPIEVQVPVVREDSRLPRSIKFEKLVGDTKLGLRSCRAAALPRADQRRPCEMARIQVDRNLTGEQGDAADGAGLHWGLEAISGQQPLNLCTTPPLIAQLPEVDWSTHSARLVYCHNFHGFHLTSTRHTCAIGMGWSERGGRTAFIQQVGCHRRI